MPEPVVCARCGEKDFMRPGDPLCTDCRRWTSKLGGEALANDRRNWKDPDVKGGVRAPRPDRLQRRPR